MLKDYSWFLLEVVEGRVEGLVREVIVGDADHALFQKLVVVFLAVPPDELFE